MYLDTYIFMFHSLLKDHFSAAAFSAAQRLNQGAQCCMPTAAARFKLIGNYPRPFCPSAFWPN